MFGALYNFFNGILYNGVVSGTLPSLFLTRNISLFDTSFQLGNYLAIVASLVSLIIIVVLCCLFVYKIIKLIGGLIR